jgi:hypothetical protein
MKKHRSDILKPTYLEGSISYLMFYTGHVSILHKISLYLPQFSVWYHIHLVSDCYIMFYGKETRNSYSKVTYLESSPSIFHYRYHVYVS